MDTQNDNSPKKFAEYKGLLSSLTLYEDRVELKQMGNTTSLKKESIEEVSTSSLTNQVSIKTSGKKPHKFQFPNKESMNLVADYLNGNKTSEEVLAHSQTIKPASSKKKILIGAVVVVLFIMFISSLGSDSPNTPSAEESTTRPTLGLGEEGVLNNNEDISNCTGNTIVASTEENLDKVTNISIAEDNYGLAEMVANGQAAMIPNCTPIKVIDRTFATRQVRFLEDPSVTGWVPYEFAVESN